MYRKMNNIKGFDDELVEFNKVLEDINFQIQDLSMDIRNYLESLEIDEEKLEFLQERIDTINKMKKKYGNSIEDIIQYKNTIEIRLGILLNNEESIKKTISNIKDIETKLMDYCIKLTDIRKKN